MKRSREFFLWAFFLAICFWAGYLKGLLPLSFKHSLFVKGSVRIYNAAPFDFPRPFIAVLEEDLGQKVDVIKIRSWDELQAKMVTKVGAHLLFAPSHWGTDLARENVIVGLSYIQPKLEKLISPDFLSFQKQSLMTVPLYWTVTKFVTGENTFAGLELSQAVQDKNLSEIHLYPDADLMATHMNKWNIQLKDVEAFTFRSPPSEIQKNALWEIPHLVHLPGARELATVQSRSLITYSLMIPKNSANRRVSYRVIETLLETSMQIPLLAAWPLSTTLRDENNVLALDKEKRASHIRDLKLNELIILENRNPHEFQELQSKYNFIF